MPPRIVIIGGGSYQWVPKLLIDVANTPSLHDAEIVLEDLNAQPLPLMATWVERIAALRGIGLSVTTTTDQRRALEGADYVVVSISTGGFTSMRQDLEVPAHYGIRQSVGDTVGPGGISRALRNVPVLVGIARDMQEECPDAWLLNLTNPMTALCRAVTRETPVKTIGLCHELTMTRFTLSLLFDTDFRGLGMQVTGVNHLPVITTLEVDGDDGFTRLRDLVDDPVRHKEPLAFDLPAEFGEPRSGPGGGWTRGDLLARHQLKLELFDRFGVLPAAGDRHLAEFFPGFLTEESGWGQRWGVGITTIEQREASQAGHVANLEALVRAPEVSAAPSGELVAALIDSFERDRPRHFPLNLPNAGQCPDLPADVVVESVCTADARGVRGRDAAVCPPGLAEHLRRVSAAQELTVEAALTGRRETVFAAMLADPLASRIDWDQLQAMTDDLLDATARWLPQFT
jgi:alpha-galactosidase/6-phospho-beta-glucosidase family protein